MKLRDHIDQQLKVWEAGFTTGYLAGILTGGSIILIALYFLTQ